FAAMEIPDVSPIEVRTRIRVRPFDDFAVVLLRFRSLLCRRPVFPGDAGDRRPMRRGRDVASDRRLVENRRCPPPASPVDISVAISKRITEDFGVSIGDTWSRIRQPGSPTREGFANLDTTFQYQLMKDASHEFAMLVGLGVEWGGTGNTGAGIATSFSVL